MTKLTSKRAGQRSSGEQGAYSYVSGISDLSISSDNKLEVFTPTTHSETADANQFGEVELNDGAKTVNIDGSCSLSFSTKFDVIVTKDRYIKWEPPVRREWDEWEGKVNVQDNWTKEDKASA